MISPTKRYCQTLDLKDDPELIKEYKKKTWAGMLLARNRRGD